MKNIIIPNRFVYKATPLIFLGGPVKNSSNWRNDAVEHIKSLDERISIAYPGKTGKMVSSINDLTRSNLAEGKENYFSYREWKNHYEKVASQNGVLLFWLEGEVKEDHAYTDYGLNTAEEIEHWAYEMKRNKRIQMSVGTDGNFKLWNELDYNQIFHDLNVDVKGNLEDTCLDAVKKCQKYL